MQQQLRASHCIAAGQPPRCPQQAPVVAQRGGGGGGGRAALLPASASSRASPPSLQQQQQRQRRRAAAVVARATDQFDVDRTRAEPLPGAERADLGPREDDVLPDSLSDAVQQAAEATAAALAKGGLARAQVEILLPEFWDPTSGPIFPNRGDQERFWRMTRRFVEALAEQVAIKGPENNNNSGLKVKAIYPDAGVAAMLSHQWQDRAFEIDSLNARRPVAADDELVVLCCPDPPGADDAQRVVRQVAEQDERAGALERPVVLFNQRLSSGDVGIGLNARRLREAFLRRFQVTYSLRPIGDAGTVYRRWPEQWKVFVEEPGLPGRYRLAAERPNRPAGEALDALIVTALGGGGGVGDGSGGEGGGGGGGGPGLLAGLGATVASMQRFMRSLSQ